MSRSSKWDEKSIETQLRKLPKIEDKQSKEVLFEKIQVRLQENQMKQKRKKNWVVPTVATAAIFFLLLLLIPSFINEQDMSIGTPEAGEEAGILMEMNGDFKDEAGIASNEEFAETRMFDDPYQNLYLSAVIPTTEDELRDSLLTIAVVAYTPSGEIVVPVTLLSDGNSVPEKFLFQKELFSGEYWGIGSFPPIQINSITEEKGGTVIIDVPTNSLENLSSAEMNIYRIALKETFSAQQYFFDIHFRSDGEPGVLFGQYGHLDGLNIDQPNRGYYIYTSPTNHQFLVRGRTVGSPYNNEEFENISLAETLEFMKQSNDQKGYQASIPEHVVISNVEEEAEIVTITFLDGLITEDNPDNLKMVEAIMFAARDFGFSYVQFEGIQLDRIGPYDLHELQVIPNYPNFIQ